MHRLAQTNALAHRYINRSIHDLYNLSIGANVLHSDGQIELERLASEVIKQWLLRRGTFRRLHCIFWGHLWGRACLPGSEWESYENKASQKSHGNSKLRTLSRTKVVPAMSMTMVPGMAYANRVLMLSSSTRHFLERRQSLTLKTALAVNKAAITGAFMGICVTLIWGQRNQRQGLCELQWSTDYRRETGSLDCVLPYVSREVHQIHTLKRKAGRTLYGFAWSPLKEAGENRARHSQARASRWSSTTGGWQYVDDELPVPLELSVAFSAAGKDDCWVLGWREDTH